MPQQCSRLLQHRMIEEREEKMLCCTVPVLRARPAEAS